LVHLKPYYTYENNKTIKYFPSKKIFVVYENNKVLNLKFYGNKFGMIKEGDLAPNFDKLIKELKL